MAITCVRLGSNAGTTAGTTLTVSVPSGGVPIGHWLVVGSCTNSANTDGVLSVADSKGNGVGGVYALDEEDSQTTRRTSCFSARITTPLLSGDTITLTVPVSCTRRAMDVLDVSGVLGKDVSTSFHDNGSTAPNSGATGVRTYADALCVGVCGWNNTVGGDLFTGSATFVGSENTVEAFTGATARYLATEFKIVGAPVGTNTANGTLPTAQAWSMLVVVYGAATAALSGAVTASIIESDIVPGGKTIVLTLSGTTWISN